MAYDLPIMMINDRKEPAPTVFLGPEPGPVRFPTSYLMQIFLRCLPDDRGVQCGEVPCIATDIAASSFVSASVRPPGPGQIEGLPIPAGIRSRESPGPR